MVLLLLFRFELCKKLGQGTYGKVQLGINKETGQRVSFTMLSHLYRGNRSGTHQQDIEWVISEICAILGFYP